MFTSASTHALSKQLKSLEAAIEDMKKEEKTAKKDIVCTANRTHTVAPERGGGAAERALLFALQQQLR